MGDYGTIKIDRREYEKHNERRKEMGLSWLEYIEGQAPEIPNHGESVDYNDIEQACRSAIREELPTERLQ